MPDDHIDFLGLARRSFRGVRLVVFGGMSGSGKSTAIDFLRRRHPDFAGQDWVRVARGPHGLRFPRCRGRTVAIDEVVSPAELWGVARLVRHNRVLVATHLPLACYAGFAIWCRTRAFRTDRNAGKIGVMLRRRGIAVSAATLLHYRRTFGANFLDAHHILERWPADQFDRSYAAFLRWCQVRRTPWGRGERLTREL
jgi:hypothetical protein